jgi:hypothetical protein
VVSVSTYGRRHFGHEYLNFTDDHKRWMCLWDTVEAQYNFGLVEIITSYEWEPSTIQLAFANSSFSWKWNFERGFAGGEALSPPSCSAKTSPIINFALPILLLGMYEVA